MPDKGVHIMSNQRESQHCAHGFWLRVLADAANLSTLKRGIANPLLFPVLQALLIAAILFLGIRELANFRSAISIAVVLAEAILLLLFIWNQIAIRRNLQNSIQRVVAGQTPMIDKGCIFSREINSMLNSISKLKSQHQQEVIDKELHLRFLMSQINPHFLYNTLESIRGQALQNDDFLVADMTETLSVFFRYCVSRKGSFVSIDDEIKNVKVYMKIMKFRFADKFEFSIILSEDFENRASDYQIPKLTLQPIIENAIIHGIHSYKNGGKITLRIEELDDAMKIMIRDNGVGISKRDLDIINNNMEMSWDQNDNISNGIALYNINRRIKVAFGELFGLHVLSNQNIGTNVIIDIPKLPVDAGVGK